MAETLILRPISDASSGHRKSSGSNAYSLINEASQDGDTTYIYQLIDSTSEVTKNTVCKVGGTAPNKLYYVSQSVATVVGKVNDTSSSSTKEVIVAMRTDPSGSDFNKTKTKCNTTTYTSYSTGNSSVGRGYYEAGTLPDLWILAATSGNKGTPKSGNKEIRITQAYITLTIIDAYRCAAVAIGGCTAIVSGTMSAGAARTWTATLQDGYNFVGWLDETNYQAYQNGNSYSVLTTDLTYTIGTISEDMTLYAVATAPITVNAVATTGVSSATVEWSASDNAYKWQATVSSGYTFVGWMTSANYQAYQNGGNYSVLSTDLTYYYMPSSDTTLYAVAREILGSITIQVSNGGTISYRSDENDPWTTVTGPQTVTLTGHVDDEYDLKSNPINSQYHMASVMVDQDQSTTVTYDFDNYIVTEVYANASENDGIKKVVIDIPASKIRYYDENDELILEKADTDSPFTAEDLDTIARTLQEGSPISVLKDPVVISIVYAIDSSALIPPVITVTSQDVLKISNKTSKTRCTVKFTADQNLTTFEARAQLTSSANWSGRNGVVVETGEPLDLGDEGWVYVDYNELPSGDGQYDIKIFGQNEGGVWSE